MGGVRNQKLIVTVRTRHYEHLTPGFIGFEAILGYWNEEKDLFVYCVILKFTYLE